MRVGFVCTGNICRSPIGEVVLGTLVELDDRLTHVQVSSAGTANWHVGREMDTRARAALDRGGYVRAGSLAQFASTDYIDDHDLIIVMTNEQRHDILSRSHRGDVTITLARSLADGVALDLADPYYGDAEEFDSCVATLSRACQELVRVHLLGDATSEA